MLGKFIVIYGINNVGKTTQAKLLVKKLNSYHIQAKFIKYPLYSLNPSGQLINDYLRNNNPYNFSAREFQILQVLNRTQYNEILKKDLEQGIWVIAEDYIGTGIAWGIGAGIEYKLLEYLNSHLLKEDLCLYLKAPRRMQSIEKNHKHENNLKLIRKVQKAHQFLAEKNKWTEINNNGIPKDVHNEIWEIVNKKFKIH